jgi:hypothetical protein
MSQPASTALVEPSAHRNFAVSSEMKYGTVDADVILSLAIAVRASTRRCIAEQLPPNRDLSAETRIKPDAWPTATPTHRRDA